MQGKNLTHIYGIRSLTHLNFGLYMDGVHLLWSSSHALQNFVQ